MSLRYILVGLQLIEPEALADLLELVVCKKSANAHGKHPVRDYSKEPLVSVAPSMVAVYPIRNCP